MIVEKSKGEVHVKFSEKLLADHELQDFLKFIEVLEIKQKNKATQADADSLAKEINQSWLDNNKHLFK